MEMFESGELAELLSVEQPELGEEPAEPEQPVQQRPIGLENRLDLGGRGLRAGGELFSRSQREGDAAGCADTGRS